MRLTPQEQEAIIRTFREVFGPNDHLWLFGSRMDDTKRGGDIDLYVESALTVDEAFDAKMTFLREVQQIIGEQKIDVVLNLTALNYHKPIYTIAKRGHQFV
jgi:predicted nucleotidyltransferase